MMKCNDMIKLHRTPKGSRRGGGAPKRQSDKVLDKVKDLKECQEKHDFLKMLTMADFENGEGRDIRQQILGHWDTQTGLTRMQCPPQIAHGNYSSTTG